MKLFIQKGKLFIYLFPMLLLILSQSVLFAQESITVRGTITDAQTKEALTGVSVVQKGTSNGTLTDRDGRYELKVPRNAVLVVTYVGYNPQSITATTSSHSVALQSAMNELEDVIVIGYGTAKRKDVTTAISSVSTKDLDQRPIVNVGQAIQGKAAGVSVIQPNGTPGAEMSIRVRGTTSFNGSNDPLYVVDGVPVDNIRFLSANDIAGMQILKDASSAAIYGSRAANGVILISTRSGVAGEAKIRSECTAYPQCGCQFIRCTQYRSIS